MTKATPADLGGSVRARVLRLSRKPSEDFQLVLTRFANERLLRRLASSALASGPASTADHRTVPQQPPYPSTAFFPRRSASGRTCPRAVRSGAGIIPRTLSNVSGSRCA